MVEIAPFLMVIVIVAIVSFTRLQRAKYGVGRDRTGNEYRLDEPQARLENDRLRDEMQKLKERVAVLERIATDNNRSLDLDREIERLRDR